MNVRASIANACLVLASVAASAVLAEGFLRLFPGLLPREVRRMLRDGPGNQGVSHPYIGHLQTPNKTFILSGSDFTATHHVDGHGFRNPWPWPETAQIVAVGDSVTFGQAVDDEQAWPAVLSRSLTRSRLVNLGLIGAGAQQYLRVYETFGVKLQPRILLVGFFARNDFWDDAMFDTWLASGVGGNYMVWRDFGRPRRVSFSLERPVGSLADAVRWHHALLSRSSSLYTLVRHARGTVDQWALAEGKVFRLPDGTRLRLFPGDFTDKTVGAKQGRREFQLTLQALQRIQSVAKANGTQMLVILQPGKEEVYLPLPGEATPDPTEPLRAALTTQGIHYLDLAPVFRRRAEAGEQLFFEVDGHPNKRGYQLIAESVLEHLKANRERYGLEDWRPTSFGTVN